MVAAACIDVVIVTRDNPELLRRALNNIHTECTNHSVAGITIVDDGSIDIRHYEELKRLFPRDRFIFQKKACGPSMNRNVGAAAGDAPFIAFLDDDIILEKDWFDKILSAITENDDIACAGGVIFFDTNEQLINSAGGVLSSDTSLPGDMLFGKNKDALKSIPYEKYRVLYCCGAATIVRRNIFQKIGGFDPSFFYMAEDFDLGLRLFSAGYRTIIDKSAFSYHRFHATTNRFSSIRLDTLYFRNILLAFFKILPVKSFARILPTIASVMFKCHASAWKATVFLLKRGISVLFQRIIQGKTKPISRESEHDLYVFNESLADMAHEEAQKSGISGKKAKLLAFIIEKTRMLWHCLAKAFRGCNRTTPEQIKHLIIHVTNACNLSCPHCFSVSTKAPTEHIDEENVCRFLSSLDAPIKSIIISGGEPCLYPDISALCQRMISICQPRVLTLPSNGSLPEKLYETVSSILKSTQAHIRISLSIDGPAHFHDKFRDLNGLFKKAHYAYSLLDKLSATYYPRLSLQVNTALTSENIACFSEMPSLVKTFFPNATFSFEPIRSGYDRTKVTPPTPDQIMAVNQMAKSCRQIKYSFPEQLRDIIVRTYSAKQQIINCVAGQQFLVIWPNGDISPCEDLPPAGNIAECSFSYAILKCQQKWKFACQAIASHKCSCSHSCFLGASFENDANPAMDFNLITR